MVNGGRPPEVATDEGSGGGNMAEQGRQKGIIGRDLGIAFVGVGRMGSQRATIAATHPAVRFLAVADIDPARARAVGEKVKADLWSGDNLEVISRPEVKAVVVSTPEHDHTRAVLQALELGKPVLVEKPIALALDDARRIAAAVRDSRGDLFVGYT